MKVLFIDTTAQRGVRIDRLAAVLDALVRLGESPSLFCSQPALIRERMANPVPMFTVEWEGFADVASDKAGLTRRSFFGFSERRRLARYEKRVCPAFSDALDKVGPELVHLNGLALALAPFARQCARSGIPYVAHVSELRAFSARELSMLEKAGKVLACSDAVRRYLNERFPEVYYRRYEIAPWPVDAERFVAPRDPSLRKRLNTAPDARVIVVPPPIEEHCGQKDVVNALATVRGQAPDAMVWFVGNHDSESGRNLELLVQEQGVADAVRFAGEDEDWPQLLAEGALFVHAAGNSRPEEGPVDAEAETVAQAMAAGLPAIVTDSGGAPDPILGTGAGAVVPPRSPAALAKAILAFLKDEKLLARARAAARARVRNALSAQAVAQRMAAIFRQAAKGGQEIKRAP